MNPAEVAQGVVAPVSAAGFSFVELFLQASIVVKIVMTGLGLASIWSWAIIFEKLLAFRRARVESDRFEQLFWSGQSLDELYASLSRGRTITMAALVRCGDARVEALCRGQYPRARRHSAARREGHGRHDQPRNGAARPAASVSRNRRLDGTVRRSLRHRLGHHDELPVDRRFEEYSLAVVAPGIAEALFATALGLMAAIPAVVFYNKFSADSSAISQRLYAFSDEFAAIVSRQIDVRN